MTSKNPKHGLLEADTITARHFAWDAASVAILNRATPTAVDIWVTIDGTDPGIEDDGSFVIPPGARRVLDRSKIDGPTEVRLLAHTGVRYELEAAE